MEEIAVQQQPSGVFISKSVHFAFCICVLFAVPFLIPGPQLLVGSIVNFVLIAAAMRYRSRHIILPLAMVPSLAVVLNGLMFGSFTLFMVYLMPIIRIGNIVLMLSIQRMKYLRGGIYFGGFLKASLIFIGAYVLVHIGVIPDMFLTMGMIQMITILIGGSGAQLLKKYL